MVFHESERFDEAEECFRRLVALDPRDADAWFHLAALLQQRSSFAEASKTYRRALNIEPRNPHLWMRLGDVEVALSTEASLNEAAQCYAHAANLQPDSAEARFNLGLVCGLRGEHEEALQNFKLAFELQPDVPAIQAGLLTEMQHVCDWSRFQELCALRRSNAAAAALAPLPGPFGLLSIPSTLSEQLSSATLYSRWISERAKVEARLAGHAFRNMQCPMKCTAGGLKRRLRVGYLSSDFHEHVTAHCMAEVFELHDRDCLETFAYSLGPDDGSAIRSRLQNAFDHFVDLRPLSNPAAAAAIQADGIDILVDLKGHTQGARTEILALRPAPVQASYLGFPATMGADFIDYIITDDFVLPPGYAACYSEKAAYLPGSYYPGDRSRPVPEPLSRSALGLPEGRPVFCCFNQAYKITPEAFGTWMRLLRAVPGSVLWLLETNRWMANNLRREAAGFGIDSARLIFAPKSAPFGYLQRLRIADLFLDTWPYNAHTTANDALWVGLPVVTFAGETLPSRVAGSQLRALGLSELVAESVEQYEALALRLARDADALCELRQRLWARRSTEPLFDTPALARALVETYEAIWRVHVSGEGPLSIRI